MRVIMAYFLLISMNLHAELAAVSNGAGAAQSKPATRADLLADPAFKKCWDASEPKPKAPSPPPDCSQAPPPKKQTENFDRFSKVEPDAIPQDALEGNMEDMRKAIRNGADHCARLIGNAKVSVGGNQFTRKDLCLKSTSKLSELAKKPTTGPDISYEKFIKKVMDSFDFYQYKCSNDSGKVKFTATTLHFLKDEPKRKGRMRNTTILFIESLTILF